MSAPTANQAAKTAPKTPLDNLLKGPNQKLTPANFFKALDLYPSLDGVSVYLYRLYPVIDRKLSDPDNPNYIDKLGEKFDRAYVERAWGSGEYQLRMNDQNRKGGNQVCWCALRIDDPDLPPVVPTDELVMGDPANRSYVEGLRARGKLPDPADEAAPANPGGDTVAQLSALLAQLVQQKANSGGNAGVESKVLDMFSQASRKAIELAGEANKPVDPVDTFLRMKDAMKGDSDVFRLMLEQQRENTQTLMTVLQDKQGGGSGGLVDRLDEMERLVTVMDKFRGGGSGGGSTLSSFLGQVPEMLGSLTSLAQIYMAARAARAGQAPGAPGAQVVPAPVPPASTGGGTPDGASAPGAGAPQPQPGAVDQATLGQVAMAAVNALERGLPGDVFAESVVTMYGDPVYDAVVAIGKQTLKMGVTQQLPPESQEAAAKFIDDFFAYGTEGAPAAAPEEGQAAEPAAQEESSASNL